MEKRELNVIIALAVIIVGLLGILCCGMFYIITVQNTQLASIRLALLQRGISPRTGNRPDSAQWLPGQPAARDSIEGKVRAQRKHWVKVPGEITDGAYVQDILEGRTDVPDGRGALGKVAYIDAGAGAAMVDFGRGYSVGIKFPELSLVEIVPGEK